MRRFCSTLMLISIWAYGARADSSISSTHRFAYASNTGWIDARADGTNGLVIGQTVCSGNLYGANVGWIHCGNGAPSNSVSYSNALSSDFGINHDGQGNLSGYAYGANIGWLNFEQNFGKPQVDLNTGNLSGSVWSANMGWISLSNLFAYVKTDRMDTGPDSDMDDIPDAWELSHTNSLVVLGGGDSDNDGVSDLDEFAGDTDPFDENDFLMITQIDREGDTNTVSWVSKPTRLYSLEKTQQLGTGAVWTVVGAGFVPPLSPATSQDVVNEADDRQYYRIKASPPLLP